MTLLSNGTRALMGEGRRVCIELPDGRTLSIVVRPKMAAFELSLFVAAQFSLGRRRDYFGLCYKDDGGCYHWLEREKPVLDAFKGFPIAIAQQLTLYFRVRHFPSVLSLSQEGDISAIVVLFLQARHSFCAGEFLLDRKESRTCLALALHATAGPHKNVEQTKQQLEHHKLVPAHLLREYHTTDAIAKKIDEEYAQIKHEDLSPGHALVRFLRVVEDNKGSLYGSHCYQVQDAKRERCILTVDKHGIKQLDIDTHGVIKSVEWNSLLNLYYREKKFSIEVQQEQKQIARSQSSYTLIGSGHQSSRPGTVTFAWTAANAAVTKAIWQMAIWQHQYFMDFKEDKSNGNVESNELDVAAKLDRAPDLVKRLRADEMGSQSPGGAGDEPNLNLKETNPERYAKGRENLRLLRAKQAELRARLLEHETALRLVCLEEYKITKSRPTELKLKEGESLPIHAETNYSINLKQTPLEMELEVARKMLEASVRMKEDRSQPKSVRKHRKKEVLECQKRIESISLRLEDQKRLEQEAMSTRTLPPRSRVLLSPTSPASPISPRFGKRTPWEVGVGVRRANSSNNISGTQSYGSVKTPVYSPVVSRYHDNDYDKIWDHDHNTLRPSHQSGVRTEFRSSRTQEMYKILPKDQVTINHMKEVSTGSIVPLHHATSRSHFHESDGDSGYGPAVQSGSSIAPARGSSSSSLGSHAGWSPRCPELECPNLQTIVQAPYNQTIQPYRLCHYKDITSRGVPASGRQPLGMNSHSSMSSSSSSSQLRPAPRPMPADHDLYRPREQDRYTSCTPPYSHQIHTPRSSVGSSGATSRTISRTQYSPSGSYTQYSSSPSIREAPQHANTPTLV